MKFYEEINFFQCHNFHLHDYSKNKCHKQEIILKTYTCGRISMSFSNRETTLEENFYSKYYT